MRDREEWIDPFGAPEIFVDGVAYREMAGTDLMRSVFGATEHGQKIIRLKLLLPASIALQAHIDLHNWLMVQRGIKLAS